MTPMDRYKYFRMKLELFPQDIINEYGLRDKVDAEGYVFCEVRRGMYGLQAGIIAQELLTKRLHKAGYRQSTITPGYWRHDWRPISFTLVVDDFGVKYINKADVEHLTSILQQDYEINIGWEGTWYLGLTIDWDYINCKGCRDTLKKLYYVSAMNPPTNRRCNHTHTHFQHTARRCSTPSHSTCRHQQRKQRRSIFDK